jgi:outer membrane receptor protein involved in Fe transport
LRSTTGGGECSEILDVVDVQASSVTQLAIRPNPVGALGTVAFLVDGEQEVTVDILDVAGRRISTHAVLHGRADLDASRMAPGVYFARAGRMVARFVVSR